MRTKLAAAVLAVTAFVAVGQLDHRGPADRGQAAIVKCAEDDPCWNCRTMGNRVCGPSTAPAACSAAIKAGIYTADLYSQCIDDYNQAGKGWKP